MVLLRPPEVKTVEDVLRLVAKKFLARKKGVRDQIETLQNKSAKLTTYYEDIINRLVMREVERRLGLAPDSLTICINNLRPGMLLIYGENQKVVYVVNDVSGLLHTDAPFVDLLAV